MPKCASSSTEAALSRACNVRLAGDPKLKHTSYREYQKFILPYLKVKLGSKADDLEVISLFRHPIGWLDSWYRFRIKEAKAGKYRRHAETLIGLTFADFLERYTSGAGGPIRVGRQLDRLKSKDGSIGRITLFKYEEYEQFLQYLSGRVGRTIALKQLNVSPGERADVSAYLHFLEHPKIAPDWAVYQTISNSSNSGSSTHPDAAATPALSGNTST